MTTCRPVHGLVHGRLWFHAEIAFITIDSLAFLGEIDPAVVERCSGGLDPADDLVVFVHQNMEFVPKVGF